MGGISYSRYNIQMESCSHWSPKCNFICSCYRLNFENISQMPQDPIINCSDREHKGDLLEQSNTGHLQSLADLLKQSNTGHYSMACHFDLFNLHSV